MVRLSLFWPAERSWVWLFQKRTELLPLHHTLYILMQNIYFWLFFSPSLSRNPQTLTDFLLLRHAPNLHSLQFDKCHLVYFFLKVCNLFFFFFNLSLLSSPQVSHFHWDCPYGWNRDNLEFLKSGREQGWANLIYPHFKKLFLPFFFFYHLWHAFLSYHRPCHLVMISCHRRSFRVNSSSLLQVLKGSII